MNADYRHMRMTNYQWVEEYSSRLGKEAFWKLLNERYKWLMKQPRGWIYNLELSKLLNSDIIRDLFIKTVCLFISEGNGDYQFSPDFTTIKRI
ncbi:MULTISPECIES: hypothetical protein [unclassified Dysgonomonas]|uniref:hypothetical protein n=1 Tax=unclassified Dysgonomonas TaxID=2630389 RepID=UPI0025BF2454|nr:MULTISPECIES: hypothetical protein [unclassified Dysgonomonas]HMM02004.1 hypothetical protein [Dysgonomonas sp.]